jgi:hypothetical protein
MKEISEVLRTKEAEILRVKKELEALKIVAGLLGEEKNEPHPEYRQMLQLP